ncbi:hypothetical protein K439DRAFT_1190666 [Ramaria rubella]|nr:hypothetical protein K439DRAFT_1190666 [Ramaria rubella]
MQDFVRHDFLICKRTSVFMHTADGHLNLASLPLVCIGLLWSTAAKNVLQVVVGRSI